MTIIKRPALSVAITPRPSYYKISSINPDIKAESGNSRILQIAESLLFGKEGNYEIAGIKVYFQTTLLTGVTYGEKSLLGTLTHICFGNKMFRFLILGYLHVFVHEMGHALSNKILTGENSTIIIDSKTYNGITLKTYSRPAWKNTAISAFGPITGMLFSACKLIAGASLVLTLTVEHF